MTDQAILQNMSSDEFHGHHRGQTIIAGRTEHQSFEIVELGDYGRALLLDGCIQSTEKDEAVYHETLVLPAYACSPGVESVLCLGGGNGGLLRQVMMMPSLRRVSLIDIDEELHEISRQYLPHMHGQTLNDPRLTLTFGPVRHTVETLMEREEVFDLVVADLPDATAGSYAGGLFSAEFYATVRRLLGPRGLYATHVGQAHFRHCRFLNRALRTLRASFVHAALYTASVPSLGTPWGFVIASDGSDPGEVGLGDVDKRLAKLLPPGACSYDAVTHRHMFSIPRALRLALAEPAPLIRDENPATVEIVVENETC